MFYRGPKLTKFSILDVRMIRSALELVGLDTLKDKILNQLSRGIIYPKLITNMQAIYQVALQAKTDIYTNYSPNDQKTDLKIL